jgi:hypothetical protein
MTNAIVNCDGFLFERVFEITEQKEKLWDWADPYHTFYDHFIALVW